MKLLKLCTLIALLMLIAFFILRSYKASGTDYTYVYSGKSPCLIDISSDGSTLYTAGPHGIMIIDKETMDVINELPFSQLFYDGDMAIDSTNEYIYCSYNEEVNGTGKMLRIRISDSQMTTIDLAPSNINGFAFDDDEDYIYLVGGVWPIIGEGVSWEDYTENVGTGRVYEVELASFTVSRTANIGVDNHGVSCSNGKLIIMTGEQKIREDILTGAETSASTCLVVAISTLEIDSEISVPPGFYNMSMKIPGTSYVMLGSDSCGYDGVGLGKLNTITEQVENWYIVTDDVYSETIPGGGAYMMTYDDVNNKLYLTFWMGSGREFPQYRLGMVDLNTDEFTDWYFGSFMHYADILYDKYSGKLYLTAPMDDAIVVIEPPGYNHPPIACFSFYPGEGYAPLTVTFENCSYDEDGEIVSIECDWDGDEEPDEFIEGNPGVFQHTFGETGVITFILTVVDDGGKKGTWIGTVNVQ